MCPPSTGAQRVHPYDRDLGASLHEIRYHPKNSANAAAISSTWSGGNQLISGSEPNQVSWRLA